MFFSPSQRLQQNLPCHLSRHWLLRTLLSNQNFMMFLMHYQRYTDFLSCLYIQLLPRWSSPQGQALWQPRTPFCVEYFHRNIFLCAKQITKRWTQTRHWSSYLKLRPDSMQCRNQIQPCTCPSYPSGCCREGWLLANRFSLVETTFCLQISGRPGSPELWQQLIENARNNTNNAPGFAFGKDDKVRQSKDKKVRPHLRMISTLSSVVCSHWWTCLLFHRNFFSQNIVVDLIVYWSCKFVGST